MQKFDAMESVAPAGAGSASPGSASPGSASSVTSGSAPWGPAPSGAVPGGARSAPEQERPDVLVQSTYEAIKDAILGNRLKPGNKLGHQFLAETLGVSRTPVRESLERLYQEGYVTRIANRGYFVAEIDVQEVLDLYQTRAALELYALRQVLGKGLAPVARKGLDDINAHYRELCLEPLSRTRLLVDRDFHLALAGQSGNGYLCRTLDGIFERLILKRRVEGYHDTRGIVPYEDHVRLLAAIDEGDGASAERILHDHIETACSRFLSYLDPQN